MDGMGGLKRFAAGVVKRAEERGGQREERPDLWAFVGAMTCPRNSLLCSRLVCKEREIRRRDRLLAHSLGERRQCQWSISITRSTAENFLIAGHITRRAKCRLYGTEACIDIGDVKSVDSTMAETSKGKKFVKVRGYTGVVDGKKVRVRALSDQHPKRQRERRSRL